MLDRMLFSNSTSGKGQLLRYSWKNMNHDTNLLVTTFTLGGVFPSTCATRTL